MGVTPSRPNTVSARESSLAGQPLTFNINQPTPDRPICNCYVNHSYKLTLQDKFDQSIALSSF